MCKILIWAVRSKFGRQFYHICGRLYYQNLCVNFDISANHKLCRNIWEEMCSLNMNCYFRVWKIIFITFVSDLMIIIWMQVVSYHFDVTLTLTKCADLYIWWLRSNINPPWKALTHVSKILWNIYLKTNIESVHGKFKYDWNLCEYKQGNKMGSLNNEFQIRFKFHIK